MIFFFSFFLSFSVEVILEKRRKCWLTTSLLFPYTCMPKSYLSKLCIKIYIVWKSEVIFILLINFMVFNGVFKIISVIMAVASASVHAFMEFFLPVLHTVSSKQPADFPHNHRRNKGQRRERNESSRKDYHQSSERLFA